MISHRGLVGAMVVASVIATGWWLVAEATLAVVLSIAFALTALGAALRAAWRVRSLVPILLVLGGSLAAGRTALEVRAVEDSWSETRDGLIERAQRRFQREITRAVARAERLVAIDVALETGSRLAAFESIARAVDPRDTDHGAVVFDTDGLPWAWGGVLREPPAPIGPTLAARMTAFYVLLEARRQDERRSVVSQVVLAADSAVPDRDRTLAARFAASTRVGLLFTSMPTEGAPLAVYCRVSCEPQGAMPVDTLLMAELVPPSQGSAKLDAILLGGRWAAALTFLGLTWLLVFGERLWRWTGFVGTTGLLLTTPTGGLLGFESLFSSATYYLAALGPFAASAGALFLSAAALVVILLQKVGGWRPLGTPGRLAAIAVISVLPWLMAFLADGITPLATGTTATHWLSWQIPLAVVGVAFGLVAGKLWGRSVLPWWWVPVIGVAGGVGLAAWGMISWLPFDGWPALYGVLWIPVAFLVIQGVSRTRVVVAATIVAGAAASVLTWSADVEARLVLAERDAGRLSQGDAVAIGMLEQFGDSLASGPVPRVSAALYARWSRSVLAWDDYPAVLDSWDPFGERIASLELAALPLSPTRRARFASQARASGEPIYEMVELDYGVHQIAAIPFPDRSVVTVAVGPRSRLIQPVLVARFLRGERRIDAPYELTLGETVAGLGSSQIGWTRSGQTIRGERTLDVTGRSRMLEVTVPLRDMPDLGVRGILVIIIDGLLVALLVGISAGLFFGPRVPAPVIEALRFRSYRVRLALALAGFFVLPTLGFAFWSLDRIRSEADRSRDLLIQGTLGDAVNASLQALDLRIQGLNIDLNLIQLGRRLGADLLFYRSGVLVDVSAPILRELGLVGPLLPPDVYTELELRDRNEMNANSLIGGSHTRVGYRTIGPERGSPILAAPQLVGAGDLQRQRQDLALGVLLVTLLGIAGAVGLAALASRSLSKPVQSLRTAAIAVGRGDTLPAFDPSVPTEFEPVVDAFVRMAHDIEKSQAALKAARRRTAAVLANVATGVVALDTDLNVTIANPRAAELLGSSLPAGDVISDVAGAAWRPVWEWVVAFMQGDDEFDEEEFALGERQIRVQVAAMHTDPRGCVVALDDTTELSRAVRVLAWGELARQVAHEIKNPLTPIRLGIQHIQRARSDRSAEFDATLEQTSRNILAEIERLDAIARAFARFGAPPAESAPLELSDVSRIAHEAAALYAVGDGPEIRVEAAGSIQAMVRRDEVKEVFINLVENARDAQARLVEIDVERNGEARVTIRVRDDGSGITKEHMSRVFEPQFSTTSSGTGLGLAICRRLVEGWGGVIEVRSEVGEGTEVTIELQTQKAAPGGGLHDPNEVKNR